MTPPVSRALARDTNCHTPILMPMSSVKFTARTLFWLKTTENVIFSQKQQEQLSKRIWTNFHASPEIKPRTKPEWWSSPPPPPSECPISQPQPLPTPAQPLWRLRDILAFFHATAWKSVMGDAETLIQGYLLWLHSCCLLKKRFCVVFLKGRAKKKRQKIKGKHWDWISLWHQAP